MLNKKFCVGGPVVRDGNWVYVNRPEEEIITQTLRESNDVILCGPRQIGKTTIASSVKLKLEADGLATAWLDLQCDMKRYEDDREAWFQQVIRTLGKQLIGTKKSVDSWIKNNNELSSSALVRDFLINFIQKKVKRPISIFIDEIDYLLGLESFATDLLLGIRGFRNKRPDMGKDYQITFTMIGVCNPDDLFRNNEDTLNIGYVLQLPDFNYDNETINSLAEGFSLSRSKARRIASEILRWTGGQPYLTIYLCQWFKTNNLSSPNEVRLMVKAFIEKQKVDPLKHFETPEDYILKQSDHAYRTISIYKEIFAGLGEPNMAEKRHYDVLRMAGLIVWNGTKWVVKSPIYEQYFDEEWCDDFESRIAVEKPQSGSYIRSVSHSSNKPQLFILNTGGTIGMEVQKDKKVRPYKNPERGFKKNYAEVWRALEDKCDIKFLQLFCKDGANIFPENWSAIARKIWELRNKGAKRGYVITHGTDTMAYTASAVAFALGRGLDFPVVFTGSQTTYAVPHGDAKSNLMRASLVALEDSIKEVVISFGDKVFRGCRSQKMHDQQFDGFESPSYRPLAHVAEEVEVHHELLLKKDDNLSFELKDGFAQGVLLIKQYPGLDTRLLTPIIENSGLKGIIIQTLGAGNMPTMGRRYSLLPLIEKATKRKLPVLIISQYPVNPKVINVMLQYEPASAPLQKGAIATGNMTSEAAVTKFMWVLAQVEDMLQQGEIKKEMKLEKVRKMMVTNYVGEVDQPLIYGENEK